MTGSMTDRVTARETWRELIDIEGFLESSDYASSTKSMYARYLGYLQDWLVSEGVGIDDLTPSAFRQFLATKDWARNTEKGCLDAVRAYFSKYRDPQHPILELTIRRVTPPPGRKVTLAKVDLLLANCPDTRAGLQLEVNTLFCNTITGRSLTPDGLRANLYKLGQRAGFKVSPHDFRRGGPSYASQKGMPDRLGMLQGRGVHDSEAGPPSPARAPSGRGIKVHSDIGFQASYQNLGGAWRLWTIIRDLDPEGSNNASQGAVRARLARMGVAESTARRWLFRARAAGVLRTWADRVEYISPARFAALLGMKSIKPPSILREPKLLFLPGWKVTLWGCWIATLDGDQMSQVKMRELTGVPERTQSYYQRKLRIETRQHYAFSDRPADHLEVVRENHPGAFVDGSGRIAWRLPDTRKPPRFAFATRPGRTRKHRKALRQILCSRAQDLPAVVRVFFESGRQLARAIRDGNHGTEVYTVRQILPQFTAWRVQFT